MKIRACFRLCGSLVLALSPSAKAESFYVDITNAVANPQMNFPTGYAHYPSYDYSGAGFSAGSGPFSPAGQGTYYTADGFLTGHTSAGLWQSSWLDALHPDVDTPPHGGLGTVDILQPGGISGALGLDPVIYGNGLAAAPSGSGDTNGQYLGIAADGMGSEYAVYQTTLVVTSTTTFQYGYMWTPAGATTASGAEILPLGVIAMGARFFIDTDTDSLNGGIVFSEDSVLRTYDGAGNQQWFAESGTFTLEPGSYYWGFAAAMDSNELAYIGLEGISISPVPEPSGMLLAGFGCVLLSTRRRRFRRG